MRQLGPGAALVVLLATLGGCGLTQLDSEYGLDGSADAPHRPDGEGGAADACSQPENCTNGVDDNCDGLVDCADPTCNKGGFACTPGDIPSGWTLVAYDATARPICPSSYGAGGEQAVVTNVGGAAATCTCGCSGTAATCEGTAIIIGYPNSCVMGTPVNLAVADGACSPATTSITATDSYELNFQSSVSAEAGNCSGAGQVMGTLAPPTFSAGATCAVSSPLGAGCTTGVCAPAPGTGFVGCITHPGNVMCPTFGFSQPTLASTGTPGYLDMRGCAGCTCATTLNCGSVTNVALFASATCEGSAAFNVNSGCQLINTSGTNQGYKVSYGPLQGSAACVPTSATPPAPTGAVVLDSSALTICCPP
jgi:hypothetical protein